MRPDLQVDVVYTRTTHCQINLSKMHYGSCSRLYTRRTKRRTAEFWLVQSRIRTARNISSRYRFRRIICQALSVLISIRTDFSKSFNFWQFAFISSGFWKIAAHCGILKLSRSVGGDPSAEFIGYGVNRSLVINSAIHDNRAIDNTRAKWQWIRS